MLEQIKQDLTRLVPRLQHSPFLDRLFLLIVIKHFKALLLTGDP